MLRNKTVLVTGGTGSFGQKFTEIILKEQPKAVRIFSRGEFLQWEMGRRFDNSSLRFFIGDIRDKDRLHRATKDVDFIIHAAALKHVPICEYNPIEAVSTNITGAINIIDCAIENGISRVLSISSDKAVHPVNLYGATKMIMEKLFIQANSYSKNTRFSCVRYGNVVGSRGSIVPLFKKQKLDGLITITDERMTRFWITLEQGAMFALNCIQMMRGGEVFIPIIPSMKVIDLADVIAPKAKIKLTGIRPGEKLHEILITEDEARHTRAFEDYFVIQPEFPFWTEDTYWDLTGEELPDGFRYSSDNNTRWLTKEKLTEMVK